MTSHLRTMPPAAEASTSRNSSAAPRVDGSSVGVCAIVSSALLAGSSTGRRKVGSWCAMSLRLVSASRASSSSSSTADCSTKNSFGSTSSKPWMSSPS